MAPYSSFCMVSIRHEIPKWFEKMLFAIVLTQKPLAHTASAGARLHVGWVYILSNKSPSTSPDFKVYYVVWGGKNQTQKVVHF